MRFRDVSYKFHGRRAVVVGGSQGIGKGVVEALLHAGAEVYYASRHPMTGQGDAHHLETDLRDVAAIDRMFSLADADGGVDIVVNTAAVNHCKTIDDIDVDEWDDVINVNLRAAFLVCRQAARRMKTQRTGRIVNVSSIAGRHRSPVSGVHYVSSKAGLIGLTRQLAFELGPFGVSVNVVCPGQTATEMLAKSMSDKQREELESVIPLRRIATVQEQVGPILFLCSDAAAYVTGAVIDVNGGQI